MGAYLLKERILDGERVRINPDFEYVPSGYYSSSILYNSCRNHCRCKGGNTWCNSRGRMIKVSECYAIMCRVFKLQKGRSMYTGILMPPDTKDPFQDSVERRTNLIENGFNILQDFMLVGQSENVPDLEGVNEQKPGRREFLELANLSNLDEQYSKLNSSMPTVEEIQAVMAFDPIELPKSTVRVRGPWSREEHEVLFLALKNTEENGRNMGMYSHTAQVEE